MFTLALVVSLRKKRPDGEFDPVEPATRRVSGVHRSMLPNLNRPVHSHQQRMFRSMAELSYPIDPVMFEIYMPESQSRRFQRKILVRFVDDLALCSYSRNA